MGDTDRQGTDRLSLVTVGSRFVPGEAYSR